MPRPLTWTAACALALALAACAKPPVDPATRAASPGSAASAAANDGGDAGAAGAAAPAPVSGDAKPIAVAWDCDGRPVAADYDNAAGQVRLQIGAELLTLPRAVSASGARYADTAGNEFWEHQGEATLALAGGKPQHCVRSSGR